MTVLGYSGLDATVDFARRAPGLRPGEERLVQGLDSAAALVVDGAVVAAAAEERFTGEKHTGRFPHNAVRYCLEVAGLRLEQVDRIGHSFRYGPLASWFRHLDAGYYDTVLAPERQCELWTARFGPAFCAERFSAVEHHLAHAASCYYPSGFADALCLVCDGMGEMASLTLYEVHEGVFRPLRSVPVRESLGVLYALATRHLGFDCNADEYKVMGLAPYGDPAAWRPLFHRLLELRPEGHFRLRWQNWVPGAPAGPCDHRAVLDWLHANVFPAPSDTGQPPQHCRDFAASLQECLETALFHVLRHWAAKTGLKHLCMAGGVALNCTFTGKLIASGLFDDVYMQPAAGDDGSALGAALALAAENGDPPRPLPFYGPEYSVAQMRAAADRFAGRVSCVDLGSADAAAADAADQLSRDRIVAWFQGRMEYGPRALGNRSILANPASPGIRERLNSLIKRRESFRPFAPAVLAECASEYFDLTPAAPFELMLATCPVRPRWRPRLPGITHVDGSARVQTVSAHKHPLFHLLIDSFGRLSGIPCVVNTSFNVQGQPIICSPETAIATFLEVGLDRLYLGSLRISKNATRS